MRWTVLNRLLLVVLLSATSGWLGCRGRAPRASAEGPIVARVGPATITSTEFRQKALIQSPMMRASFTTLEKKKQFLERLIRLDLLMQESVREGLDKDPEVQEAKEQGMPEDGLRQKMANEMLHDKFDKHPELKGIPEPEVRAFYDAHRSDYLKPERVRLEIILLKAKEGDRKVLDEARRLLIDLKDKEAKGNGGAFATTARARSDDEATKARGGDIDLRTREDLTRAYGAAVAQAAFGLKRVGDMSDPVRGNAGWYLLKLMVRQNAVDESFEQVKRMIEARLLNEKRTALIDAWVAELRAKGNVVVYEDELDKIDLREPGGLKSNAP
jgi:peptidyl-prolyl cis-trans isomerase C